MTIQYVKTLITDEATDEDSPITETLMQDMGQSINFALRGYMSSWTSITNTTTSFPHGLGATPNFIIVWASENSAADPGSGWPSETFVVGDIDDSHHFTADSTNVDVSNDTILAHYYKVFATIM